MLRKSGHLLWESGHCFSKSANAGMMIVTLLTSINEENVVQVPLKIFLSVRPSLVKSDQILLCEAWELFPFAGGFSPDQTRTNLVLSCEQQGQCCPKRTCCIVEVRQKSPFIPALLPAGDSQPASFIKHWFSAFIRCAMLGFSFIPGGLNTIVDTLCGPTERGRKCANVSEKSQEWQIVKFCQILPPSFSHNFQSQLLLNYTWERGETFTAGLSTSLLYRCGFKYEQTGVA